MLQLQSAFGVVALLAIAWALGEIARDPLDTRPGPAPQVAAPGEGTAGEAAAPAGANATAGAVTSTR